MGARVLLEREHELAALHDGLDRAAAGEGTLTLIEGPAGVGKTELVREARASAERPGVLTLAAQGSELEQRSAFGVVRQLLDPVVTGGLGTPICSPARPVRPRGCSYRTSSSYRPSTLGLSCCTACTGLW
jgi:hypothetical protein